MKTRKSAGEIVSPLSKPLSLQSLRLQTLTSAALLATLLVISGCAGTSRQIAGVIKPYRIDVVQGNFVSREQAAAVKVGMTGAQVQQILGTPLLIDPFHLSRWDYVFYIQPGNGIAEQRRHTVLFDKAGKVSSTEGDALPSEDEFVAQLDNLRRGIKTDPAAASAPAVAAAPVAAAPAVVVAAPVAVPAPAPAVVVPVPAPAVVAPAPARLPPPPPPVAPPPPPVAPPAPVVRAPVAPPPVIAPAPVVVAPPVAAPPEVKAAPAPMPAPVPAPAPAPVAAPVPAPVVAAAPPAPAAPAAQASASELDREVLTALNAWRLAWAGRNVSAYFAAYTADFKGDSPTRAEWQKQRAERIASARGLRVEVTDVRVRAIDATRLQVAFTQSYRSEELTQVGEKSLFFVKQGGLWLIEREVFFAK